MPSQRQRNEVTQQLLQRRLEVEQENADFIFLPTDKLPNALYNRLGEILLALEAILAHQTLP